MTTIDKNRIFQVSVKGLCRDKDGLLLALEEREGTYDLPGGRLERGEDLLECLHRECVEELGLRCTILHKQPTIVYAALDTDGNPRLMLYYDIAFESLDFTPTDECVAIKFCTKEEIKKLPFVPQTKKLAQFL